MKLNLKFATQVINRNYQREKIHSEVFERFANTLDNYFYYTNRGKEQDETAEDFKKYVGNFLAFFFPNHYQNTKSYNKNHQADLVIATPNEEQPKVQVLLEIRKSDDTSEMITPNNVNQKVFHQLVLSYLLECLEQDNHNVKHLIISNIESFFIFDAVDFNRLFYKNVPLIHLIEKWINDKTDSVSMKDVYKLIEKIIDDSEETIDAIHLDLYSFQHDLEQLKEDETTPVEQQKIENRLSQVYKIFASEFLLKEKIIEKPNQLNKAFYNELIHILGLEEKQEGNKTTIVRCENPNVGSLLENTITKLRTEDLLYSLRHPKDYGKTEKEQYFNVGLELTLTWLNRILFLKLLEAQLVSYNIDDTDKDEFRFLHPSKVDEFDILNTLFFEVLALPEKDRERHITKQYGRIPYLNSSLFEVTNLERQTLRISNIKDSTELPIYAQTILKAADGTSLATDETNVLPTLEYLLSFLEAYDFGLEASYSVVNSETKPLINPSILGLVLEKLNGYKEGVFFTPGFITMYMSSETLRRVVVDKFNDSTDGFGLNANSFEDVRNFCQKFIETKDFKKANDLINSITVCDPAVGSGHFLVSILNELLAIKSELGILCDLNGQPLKHDIDLRIEEDELVVYDNLGLPFLYKVSFDNGLRKLLPDLQRIQETIFHEKKYLIEHSLFGVDINPNAVKICRLRLWVELLKNTYYRQRRNTQLETLPNIDINIKAGNSLISRFGLDTDLNDVFKRTEYSVEEYKRTVKAYKTEENKGQKRQLSRYLAEIKSEFQVTFDKREKEKIAKIRGRKDSLDLQIRYNKNMGYEPTNKELEDFKKYTTVLTKLETERDEILSSDIYDNAFEWRFEFPEVLDENGNFVGFDIVMGNPPHIRQEEIKPIKSELKKHFEVYQSTADIYVYFLELGLSLIRKKGIFNVVVPNKWLQTYYGKSLRQFIQQKCIFEIIDFEELPIFPEVGAQSCIISLNNEPSKATFRAIKMKDLNFDDLTVFINKNAFDVDMSSLSDEGFNLINKTSQNLLNKITNQGTPLQNYVDGDIFRGVLTGYNKAFIINEATKNKLIGEDSKSAALIKPFLSGKEIYSYESPANTDFLIFTPQGTIIENYPAIQAYLLQFKTQLEPKPNDWEDSQKWLGRKSGNYKWYEIQDKLTDFQVFENSKIVYPFFQAKPTFILDDNKRYFNNITWAIPNNDKYLLGLLNSSLGWFLIKNNCPKIKNGYQLVSKYLNQFPIKKINTDDAKEQQLQNQIIQKVEDILAIKKTNSEMDTTALTSEIDALIFELYDLTEAEIELIETTIL